MHEPRRTDYFSQYAVGSVISFLSKVPKMGLPDTIGKPKKNPPKGQVITATMAYTFSDLQLASET